MISFIELFLWVSVLFGWFSAFFQQYKSYCVNNTWKTGVASIYNSKCNIILFIFGFATRKTLLFSFLLSAIYPWEMINDNKPNKNKKTKICQFTFRISMGKESRCTITRNKTNTNRRTHITSRSEPIIDFYHLRSWHGTTTGSATSIPPYFV